MPIYQSPLDIGRSFLKFERLEMKNPEHIKAGVLHGVELYWIDFQYACTGQGKDVRPTK